MISYEIYPGKNTGFFELSERTINTDIPDLIGLEVEIAKQIKARLRKKEKVTVVGFGEMLAASLIAIATHFREAISDGELDMVATNLEEFDPSDDNLTIWSVIEINKDGQIISVPDSRTGEFIRNNLDLVRWIGGVESSQLSERLQSEGIGKVHFLHERFGALHYSENGIIAVKALSEAMAPRGLIYTTTNIRDRSRFGNIKDVGIELAGKPIVREYDVYRRK